MTTLWAVAWKDLRAEARAPEVAPAMVVLGLALVFVFTFALPPGSGRAPVPPPIAGAVAIREIAGALIWGSILFAAAIGLGRSAAADEGKIDGLVLAPVDSSLLYAGKLLANFAFLAALEVVVLPAFLLLIGAEASRVLPEIIWVAGASTLGIAAAGTLFGASSNYARSRALVLPLLLFPAVLPVVLAASRLTSALMLTGTTAGEGRWFILILTYDIAMTAVGAVTYEFVIRE